MQDHIFKNLTVFMLILTEKIHNYLNHAKTIEYNGRK